SRPDLLHDRRRAGLLANLDVVVVTLLGAAYVTDGSAARGRGARALIEIAVEQQQARGPRPAQELMRAHYNRVEPICTAGRRCTNVDVYIRTAGGVIENGKGVVGVEQGRDGTHVGKQPGDVAGSRERPQLTATDEAWIG